MATKPEFTTESAIMPLVERLEEIATERQFLGGIFSWDQEICDRDETLAQEKAKIHDDLKAICHEIDNARWGLYAAAKMAEHAAHIPEEHGLATPKHFATPQRLRSR